MWIAFRLVLALIGFVVRQVSRRRKPTEPKPFEGQTYFADIDRGKRGITGFKIGMPRRSPTWIRMDGESAVDRLAKRLRIAREIQTGDAAFDDSVYVICDHPYVETVLKETPRLRDAIREALGAGYSLVVFDGATLWLERSATAMPEEGDLRFSRRSTAPAAAWRTTCRLGWPNGSCGKRSSSRVSSGRSSAARSAPSSRSG